MILAHKIRLDPNDKQATYFSKACGVARFAYNWALAEWKRLYKAGEKVSEGMLRKRLNAIKHTEFPWMSEVTKCAPQLAIKDGLNKAFRNFFAKRAGFPKFKKKGQHDSFSLSNDQFRIDGKKIKIPNLGWVRMTEELRFDGKIIGAVVRRKADGWFVSVQVEIQDPMPIHTTISENQAIGVDLGVKDLAILSNGTKITGVKPHSALLSRVRRLNQSLSRKQGAKKGEKKSGNFKKAQKKLSKLHARISDIRNDETHKLYQGAKRIALFARLAVARRAKTLNDFYQKLSLARITGMLSDRYSIIGIEDLNVSDMSKNHRLARAILDMSFSAFRRQLEYKSKMKGGHVIVADRFYPSSKTCSCCGCKNENLTLSIREWTCPNCGINHDRDINAATNLKKYAVSYMVSACGELVETITSVKQELNIALNRFRCL